MSARVTAQEMREITERVKKKQELDFKIVKEVDRILELIRDAAREGASKVYIGLSSGFKKSENDTVKRVLLKLGFKLTLGNSIVW